MMRAAVVLEAGRPLSVVELEEPTPGDDQMVVRVAAAGVNPVDWKVASGAYGEPRFPFVPGIDGAGTVRQVGRNVTGFSVGDRVFGRLPAESGRGTYAEAVVAPAVGVILLMPAGLAFQAAAALPVAGLTAWGVLESLALPPGATLLVIGATGGVGMFLTQLASRAGLDVVATAAPDAADRMRGLGASVTLDHHAPTSLAEQLRAARPDGVQGIADLVGDARRVDSLLGIIRPGGVVMSTAGGADAERLEQRGLRGGAFQGQGSSDWLRALSEQVVRGELEVPLTQVLPLEEAPRAFEQSRSGHMRGKTVLDIAT